MQHIPWAKIKALQKEIDQLKGLNEPSSSSGKKIKKKSLFGIWEGKAASLSDKDFKDAKHELFTHSHFKDL